MYKEGKILARPLRCGEAVVKPDAPGGNRIRNSEPLGRPMDILDNENMREEIPDVTSPARDHPFVTGTQESACIEMHRHSWFAHT
jgi:hypothetical protein